MARGFYDLQYSSIMKSLRKIGTWLTLAFYKIGSAARQKNVHQ